MRVTTDDPCRVGQNAVGGRLCITGWVFHTRKEKKEGKSRYPDIDGSKYNLCKSI